MSGLRVTVVVNDVPGGSETFLGGFVGALTAAGHRLTLVPLRPTRSAAGLGSDVEVAPALPRLASARAPIAAASLVSHHPEAARRAVGAARRRTGRSLGRRVRDAGLVAPLLATRPDVVHFSFSGIAVAYEEVLDLLDGVRLVTSCRGSAELVQPLIEPERRAVLGRVLARLDAVHAVSGAMAETVVAMGAEPERVGIVRPAVDLVRFAPADLPVRPADGPLRLVSVGRLTPLKGTDDLLTAVAEVRRRGVDVRLTLVGDGPHRDATVARAHLLGVAAAVEMAGALPPERVASALTEADVFVSASLSEGISNALLEAMATGRAVVVTAVGGTSEVVSDGRDGLLVAAGDPSALADALVGLARDRDRLATLAAAGRARVEEAFGRERFERDWVRFYDDRLHDPPRAGAGGGVR